MSRSSIPPPAEAIDAGEDPHALDVKLSYFHEAVKEEAVRTELLRAGQFPPPLGEVKDNPAYRKVVIEDVESLNLPPEAADVARVIFEGMQLREKYTVGGVCEDTDDDWSNRYYTEKTADGRVLWREPSDVTPERSEHFFCMVNGIFLTFSSEKDMKARKNALFTPANVNEYYRDISRMNRLSADPPAKSFCHQRLCLLERRYELHVLLNHHSETAVQKTVPHRDFYNIRKVDTHVHHSASMNQKHLLRFIKKKLKTEPDEVVIFRDGKDLTLQQVFDSLRLTAYELSVDTLDVHADKHTFHRFDKFNLKYNPVGESRLREIFLKTNNRIGGRYLAEITKEIFDDLEYAKYQFAEYRLSIYGNSPQEWEKLSSWVCDHGLFHQNVRWMIQTPRLWHVFKASGLKGLDTFANLLSNIFEPLFAATIDPAAHPKTHRFLQQVVGFDCVDDESRVEHQWRKKFGTPEHWTDEKSPPYSYWMFYLAMNIRSLNALRRARGMNTFAFRPHSGEAGEIDHLACTFMLADSINHGINLRKTPVLQYLFYLKQVGLALSPLSNNSLFLDYHKNPFRLLFARGLNVSLSTDDPLQFHFTREPLIEEYSIAAQVWKLSAADMAEIARNSVLQSGIEHVFKVCWLGERYQRSGPDGNDIRRTNIPNMRLAFREDCMRGEWAYCMKCLMQSDDSGDDDFELTLKPNHYLSAEQIDAYRHKNDEQVQPPPAQQQQPQQAEPQIEAAAAAAAEKSNRTSKKRKSKVKKSKA